MAELRVRAMVGEGRSARKGLLRFVLENEGHTVVSEASSTLELAQQLVVHRPDVVVLDDGIDAGAVGMIREVLPAARVILVWPKGVSAVGADARLEPSEVMTGLGPAIDRVMGRGPVVPPARPRQPVPDVIVVPDAEPVATPEPQPLTVVPEPAVTTGAPIEEGGPEPASTTPAAATATADEPIVVVPEALSGVMLEPSTEAPAWVFAATPPPGAARETRAYWWLSAGLVVLGLLIGAMIGAAIWGERTIAIRGVVGSIGSVILPTPTVPGGTVTSEQPGTYEGLVQVQADGTIRLASQGDLRLQVDGFFHLVADGVVKVSGAGVVKNTSNAHVRVHGNGTFHLVVSSGHVHLRLQGSLVGRGEGTVHIDGIGRFLIRHRPI